MKLDKDEIKAVVLAGYVCETDEYGHVKVITKLHRTIWIVCLNKTDLVFGWQTADLVDEQYCNHKKYHDILEAIKRPL